MSLDQKKTYKVLTCCGIGQGTSTLLARNVKRVLDEMNIKASVEAAQVSVGASQGKSYDMILCNRNLVANLEEAAKQGCKVIGIKNIMSTAEIKEKILEAFE